MQTLLTAPPEWVRPIEDPVPDSWHATDSAKTTPFPDAGKAIVALRQPELVGNQHARDDLWNALTQMVTSKKTQVVFIEGDIEHERELLLSWFVAGVREVTTVQLLDLDLDTPPSVDPFRQFLETTLVAWGMPQNRATPHIQRMVEALAGLNQRVAGSLPCRTQQPRTCCMSLRFTGPATHLPS